MDANQTSNVARVAGRVSSVPIITTRNGEAFYSFTLDIRRSSGIIDTIPIRASRYLIEEVKLGDQIALEGQIRTYQKFAEGRNHLIIVFLTCEVQEYERDLNSVNVVGFLCTKPHYRTTPLGRDICDLMLAVKNIQEKADYLPCIAWDRKSKYVAQLQVGTKLAVSGRLQSRPYTKLLPSGEVESRVAYELSVGTLVECKG